MSSNDDELGDEPESRRNIRVKGPNKKRFETIFTLGKRVKGDAARIIACPGTGLIGIAVSRKIGSHPRRNKLKRRFREAISGQGALLNRQLDYVVVVNNEAAETSFEQIELEVRELFAKIVERWAEESEFS